MDHHKTDTTDFLASQLRLTEGRWHWKKHMLNAYPDLTDIYSCIFSFTRISQKAIEYLFRERQELSSKFIGETIKKEIFPNDESFCSTMLIHGGFACSAFQKYFSPKLFNLDKLFHSQHVKDGSFYHSVTHDYAEFEYKRRRWLSNGRFTRIAEKIGTRFEENNGDLVILNSTLRMLNQRMASKIELPEYPQIAYITHRQTKKDKYSNAKIEDFVLGPATYLEEFRLDRFTPYAFDPRKEILYLVDTAESVFRHPFFYMGQFESATSVVSIPLSDINVEEVDEHKIMFVFSIGRCGSTLLCNIYEALGHGKVSECDIFSSLSDTDVSRNVIKAGINLLSGHQCTVGKKVVYKFKSHVNKNVNSFISLFPGAKFIFLYREKEAWAKSFVSKFKWGTDLLVNTYQQGYECLKCLKSSGVNLKVQNYDDLINDPFGIMDQEPTKGEMSAIQLLMKQDSQLETVKVIQEIRRKQHEIIDNFLWRCKVTIK